MSSFHYEWWSSPDSRCFAQLAGPMEIAVALLPQLAERLPTPWRRLDLPPVGQFQFKDTRPEQIPWTSGPGLTPQAASGRPIAGVMNAANEQAVRLFLDERVTSSISRA